MYKKCDYCGTETKNNGFCSAKCEFYSFHLSKESRSAKYEDLKFWLHLNYKMLAEIDREKSMKKTQLFLKLLKSKDEPILSETKNGIYTAIFELYDVCTCSLFSKIFTCVHVDTLQLKKIQTGEL